MTMPGGSPQPGAVPAGTYGFAEPPVAQAGRIAATQTQIITPIAAWPAGDVQVTVQDDVVLVRKTPTWAIVLAIVGFFVITLFSLLFLLAKEQVPSRGLRVTVAAKNGQTYSELIPAETPAIRDGVLQQIRLMQQIADRERWRLAGSA